MRKRSYTYFSLGCAILLLACTILGGCWEVYGVYTTPQKRDQPVKIRELLVDPSVFPPGWEIAEESRIPEKALVEYGAGEGYVRFVVPEGSQEPWSSSAGHLILRYRNHWQAMKAFYLDSYLGAFGTFYAYFPDAISRWEEPEGWTYRSPVASRFRFACQHFYDKDWGQGIRCSALAQYDEFISDFRVNVVLGLMSLGDIEGILRSIDERMAIHLGK